MESTGDEPISLLVMASSSSNPKASQNKPKRPRENDPDTLESEHSQPTMSTASPRFLVIHSQGESSISSFSPFVIEKVLIGMASEPRSIKKLRSGYLLVEYTNKKANRKSITLEIIPQPESASVSACLPQHLQGVSEEEIFEEMRDQGVIHVRRIKVRRDDALKDKHFRVHLQYISLAKTTENCLSSCLR